MVNVWQIAPYYLTNARFGGPIRCNAIRSKLIELGHKVKVVQALPFEGVIESSENKAFSTLRLPDIYRSSILNDGLEQVIPNFAQDSYYCSEAGQKDLEKLFRYKKKPDLIFFEQPFMFRAVQKFFLTRTDKPPKFVYSSQNIESQMYEPILNNIKGLDKSDVEKWVTFIREIEEYAAANADLVMAVTSSDAEYLEKFSKSPVVICPNAAHELVVDAEANEVIRQKLHVPRFALFVASPHPPNVSGFQKMIGLDLDFLPPDVPIVIAGGVSESLFHLSTLDVLSTFKSRTILIRTCGDKELHALRDLADIILLPITEGGGSNLKTAEALLSPGVILATSTAMRGFENYITSPGVIIADNKVEYRAHLRNLMLNPQLRHKRDSNASNPLRWSDALMPLGEPLLSLTDLNGKVRRGLA